MRVRKTSEVVATSVLPEATEIWNAGELQSTIQSVVIDSYKGDIADWGRG